MFEQKAGQATVVAFFGRECVIAFLQSADHLVCPCAEHASDEFAFVLGENIVDPVIDFCASSEQSEADFVAIRRENRGYALHIPLRGVNNKSPCGFAISLFSSE